MYVQAVPAPPPEAHTSGSGPTVQSSLFEGLFVRALHVQGELLEELKRLGYDPDDPRPAYPRETWIACIHAARARLFPHLSLTEAYRELGRQFAEGYMRTLVGRVIAASLPLLGPHRAVASIPRFVSFGRDRVSVDVANLEDRAWRVTFEDAPADLAPFTLGFLEAGMRHAGVTPLLEVAGVSPTRFDVIVRW